MSRRRKICKRCAYMKTRQGKGTMGECRIFPPRILDNGNTRYPDVDEADWCGEFQVNTDKYHTDGKKIYTRIDTRQVSNEG